MRFQTVKIENDDRYNITAGLASGIQITREIQNIFRDRLAHVRFALAYIDSCASVVNLVGSDDRIMALAQQHAREIFVGDFFVLITAAEWEKQVLKHLRSLPAIRKIHISTRRSIEMIVDDNGGARAIIGVADDYADGNGSDTHHPSSSSSPHSLRNRIARVTRRIAASVPPNDKPS